jgi:hypothetical protein
MAVGFGPGDLGAFLVFSTSSKYYYRIVSSAAHYLVPSCPTQSLAGEVATSSLATRHSCPRLRSRTYARDPVGETVPYFALLGRSGILLLLHTLEFLDVEAIT